MKKSRIVIFLFLFFQQYLFSQPIVFWQRTLGGSGFENAGLVKYTSDGGTIIGGQSDSDISGNKNENSLGGDDFWIIKLDVTGAIQWQNTIGGNNNESINSIQQTIEGGFIISGWSSSNSSGDKSENCFGFSDFWIVKIGANGVVEWENTIGGSGLEDFCQVKQTSDGGFIVGGNSNSNISGDKTENGIGLSDLWIVKLDANGNIIWQNTIGGNDNDYLGSIEQTLDGGYIIASRSDSYISGDKTEDNLGGGDFWVIKTDANGSIEWQNTIGGLQIESVPAEIHQTSDNGYILGGCSISGIGGDKSEINIGDYDFWILKLDTSGDIQWQNTIGGDSTDNFAFVIQTIDNGYYLGGTSWSNISGDKTENNVGWADYWIIKADSSGNIQWQNTIGGADGDNLNSLDINPDGEIVFSGISASGISGDKTTLSIGNGDFWILKVVEDYNVITGNLYVDLNSSQTQEFTEHNLKYHPVYSTVNQNYTFTDSAGKYDVYVLDSGYHSVYTQPINYFDPVPAMITAHFTGINQTSSQNDFAFQPNCVVNDLCVTITPMTWFRVGMSAAYNIHYENVGFTFLNGTVVMALDTLLNYTSSVPSPVSVSPDSIVWDLGLLAPYQSGDIEIIVTVPVSAVIGTIVSSSCVIEPVANDTNPACNYSSWPVTIMAPYDPNTIQVNIDTIYADQTASPPPLDYIISFQNTGNDTAFNILVVNTLPVEVDISTIEIQSFSHSITNIEYVSGLRQLKFEFNNILLPDSGINELGSHAFIRYRITPKESLSIGTVIKSIAYIYFDFNVPVVTNTATTEVVSFNNIFEEEGSLQKIILYPNPAEDFVICSFHLNEPKAISIVLVDLFGKEIFQMKRENLQSGNYEERIDLNNLPGGVYFVWIKSENQSLAVGKLVVQ